ncbi:MAG: amino acid permease [bacterium]|nr:amino acid permease [bacterium]
MSEKIDKPVGAEEVKLTRNMGLMSATMLGVGSMIGAGIFILSGIAIGAAGPGAIVSYLLVGLMTLFTALSFCELSSAIPVAGGGYTYVHEGIGGIGAFLTGWTLIFGMVVSASLYAVGFAEHFDPFVFMGTDALWGIPQSLPHWVWGAAIIIVLGFINVIGSKESAGTQNLFTIGKIIFLVVFAAVAFPFVDWEAFEDFVPNGTLAVLATTSLIYISFFGFQQISNASEEIKNPEKNVPRAILLSLIIPAVIYVLVILISVGITDDWRALGTAEAPLAIIAGKVFGRYGIGTYGMAFILIAGIMSTVSALNATVMTASRAIFAVSRDGFMPNILSKINRRFRTPHFATLVVAVLAILFAVMGGTRFIAQLTNFCLLFSLLLVNLSVIILRKRRPDLNRPFKLWFGYTIPIMGILTNLTMMAFMEWTAYVWGIGYLIVGAIVYFVYSKGAKRSLDRDKIISTLMEKQARKEYKILVPVSNPSHVKPLLITAAAIAKKYDGEILTLSVIEVPDYDDLETGYELVEQRRPLLTLAEGIAAREGVTNVNRMIKIGHRLSYAIVETAQEESCNFIVMGRPSKRNLADRLLATVIDAVLKEAPCDVAVVQPDGFDGIDRVLVPVSGSENSRLATGLAPAFAEKFDAEIKVFNVRADEEIATSYQTTHDVLDKARTELEGVTAKVSEEVIYGPTVVDTILNEIHPGDIVLMGASKGGAWEQLLFKSVPEEVAERMGNSVITFKKFVRRKRSRLERLLSGKRSV